MQGVLFSRSKKDQSTTISELDEDIGILHSDAYQTNFKHFLSFHLLLLRQSAAILKMTNNGFQRGAYCEIEIAGLRNLRPIIGQLSP